MFLAIIHLHHTYMLPADYEETRGCYMKVHIYMCIHTHTFLGCFYCELVNCHSNYPPPIFLYDMFPYHTFLTDLCKIKEQNI